MILLILHSLNCIAPLAACRHTA